MMTTLVIASLILETREGGYDKAMAVVDGRPRGTAHIKELSQSSENVGVVSQFSIGIFTRNHHSQESLDVMGNYEIFFMQNMKTSTKQRSSGGCLLVEMVFQDGLQALGGGEAQCKRSYCLRQSCCEAAINKTIILLPLGIFGNHGGSTRWWFFRLD